MTNDRKRELERLEKELLADIAAEDDLLADIPIELLDTTDLSWTDTEDFLTDDLVFVTQEELDYYQDSAPVEDVRVTQPSKIKNKKAENARKREDKWLITLMAVASFLCIGIIGVLIYWLEIFLL